MPVPLAIACLALAAALLVAYVAGRTAADRTVRLFTVEQRRQVGEAWGANCVWRPCHWLPLAALLWTLRGAQEHGGRWWWAVYPLAALTGFGMPLTRRVHRCRGTVQGGHQRAYSRGGGTTVWNCEPCCGRHNLDQSTTWSLAYAARQFGPLSLVPYLVRATVGNTRLMWSVLTARR